MIEHEIQQEIITFISDEVKRIKFGKLLIEVTVMNGHCTNIQAETKRSYNLNRSQKPSAGLE